jgi:integrase
MSVSKLASCGDCSSVRIETSTFPEIVATVDDTLASVMSVSATPARSLSPCAEVPTVTRYDRDLRLHIRPRFERAPLAKITPRDVRAWLSEMQASGIPASSIRRRFSVSRKVVGDAVAMDMIVRTPCRGVTPPADTRLDITVLSATEVAQLATAMPTWCQTWVWVAAYTGLRWSEMIGLQRRDIDMLRKTLTVHRQIIEVGSRFEGFGEPRRPLGAGRSTCRRFCARCSRRSWPSAPQPGVEGLVFVNTRGNPPHLSSFTSQTWKKAREKIGRPDLRWHDLRHTAVALAIANGAHPKSIQERMGHSSITVTLDRYGHLFPSLGVAVADGLEQTYRSVQMTSQSNVRPLREDAVPSMA